MTGIKQKWLPITYMIHRQQQHCVKITYVLKIYYKINKNKLYKTFFYITGVKCNSSLSKSL